ncbi:MAG: type VII secretion protein EccB [Jatrophihabitans sp.]|uniref:type VII secretion protein EccB n=1 Tax=Jatrophihabitans sp. TaxID=1932789 RepID=UPI003F805A5E
MAQSRRDQLQAYRFLTRRAQSALVAGEPDTLDAPMRRLTTITLVSVFVALLVVGGAALKGLLGGRAATTASKDGTVVIEEETGARYVVLGGVLHPALNFTSAELAAGSGKGPDVVTAARADLAHRRRGATIGIAGLPDSLPAASGLVHKPLVSCSRLVRHGVDGVQARTDVSLGVRPSTTALPTAVGVVVQTPGGTRSLLWQGRRYDLADDRVATQLGLDSAQPLVVTDAFLDAVPFGGRLTKPRLDSSGASTAVSINGTDRPVGLVLHVRDDDSWRVVLSDGIAPIDPLDAVLLGGNATTVSAASLVGAPRSQQWDSEPIASQVRLLPPSVPKLDGDPARRGGLCAVYAKPSDPTPTFALPSTTGVTGFGSVTESSAAQQGTADSIVVPPGGAALVRSAHSATVFLVADPGRRYALPSAEVQGMLGYADVTADVVPDFLLSTLPGGPALDPAKARTTAS